MSCLTRETFCSADQESVQTMTKSIPASPAKAAARSQSSSCIVPSLSAPLHALLPPVKFPTAATRAPALLSGDTAPTTTIFTEMVLALLQGLETQSEQIV